MDFKDIILQLAERVGKFKDSLSTLLFLFIFVFISSAQDYIKPVNGDGFYTNITDASGDLIIYKQGSTLFSIAKEDVILVEFIEKGLIYYNKQYINELDVTDITGYIFSKGNCVYVPYFGNKIVKRRGAYNLRNILKEDGFWKVVDCPEEAHFIIEFVLNESVRPNTAHILIKERDGKVIFKSKSVNATSPSPYRAGNKAATGLYENYLKKLYSYNKKSFERNKNLYGEWYK